jgi:hypothetical protein
VLNVLLALTCFCSCVSTFDISEFAFALLSCLAVTGAVAGKGTADFAVGNNVCLEGDGDTNRAEVIDVNRDGSMDRDRETVAIASVGAAEIFLVC